MKVGFSKVDITLPLGTGLAGDFKPRPAVGVLDELYLCCVAALDGENTFLLITVDCLGMRKSFCDEIIDLISKKTSVKPENIIINALHQHTSFVLRPKGETCALEDKCYIDVLYRKFCDVAVMAIDDAAESKMFYGTRHLKKDISFVRRYFMKDGSIKTNPMDPVELIDTYVDKADNNLRLVRFSRDGKKDIFLISFATHADVIGGTAISADWPGLTRRMCSESFDCECIVTNGFEGDCNHIDFLSSPSKIKGSELVYDMAKTITDTAEEMLEKLILSENSDVKCSQSVVFVKNRTDGVEDYEICSKIYSDFLKTLKVPKDAPIRDLAYLRRVSSIYSDPIYRAIPVSIAKIGDVLFFGLGGEPFTGYGKAFRARFEGKTVLTLCCANGFEGYLPTLEAYCQGGYEVTASPFEKELEEICIEKAVEMTNKLI